MVAVNCLLKQYVLQRFLLTWQQEIHVDSLECDWNFMFDAFTYLADIFILSFLLLFVVLFVIVVTIPQHFIHIRWLIHSDYMYFDLFLVLFGILLALWSKNW